MCGSLTVCTSKSKGMERIAKTPESGFAALAILVDMLTFRFTPGNCSEILEST